jgi:hypothetical protein
LVVKGDATFSRDRVYRYTLMRRWARGPAVLFIMLNPSTADAVQMDPTVTRCYKFARRWGYAALYVGNMYAVRSPDPLVMKAHPDPVGNPKNDSHLSRMVRRSELTVVAWGAHATVEREREVLDLIINAGQIPHALALTKAGHPRHPLYLKGDIQPRPLHDLR